MSEEEDSMGLDALFLSEHYSLKSFHFGCLEQELLCSTSSSTRHDLTGQIVWPAALLLSHFVHSQREALKGATVLELGAGCGLAGFVAANYCERSVITDGNDVVLRLLERNRVKLGAPGTHTCRLIWGDIAEIESIVKRFGPIRVVIGADVVLWPQHVQDLLVTIRLLLCSNPTISQCFISYVVRATSTTTLLREHANKLRLSVQDIPVASFFDSALPQDAPLLAIEKHLFKISLEDANTADWTKELAMAYAATSHYSRELSTGFAGSAY